MAIVKITNGLFNHGGAGFMLSATLERGQINAGDKLILNENTTIPIINVEYVNIKTSPGVIHIILIVPRNSGIQWYKLFGHKFQTEN